MNQTLQSFATLTGVCHHGTIPYSKEENGIVERANKDLNRHLKNILADKKCVDYWPQMLCMPEKLLNSSIKKLLGASPNPLLFGNAINHEPIDIKDMNQKHDIGKYVEKFMLRQSKLFLAVDGHLKKRYAQYKITPMLQQRSLKDITDFSDVDHNCTIMPISMAHIMVEHTPRKQSIFAARKRIKDPSNDDTYIRGRK